MNQLPKPDHRIICDVVINEVIKWPQYSGFITPVKSMKALPIVNDISIRSILHVLFLFQKEEGADAEY